MTFLWCLTRSAVLDFKIDFTGEREERDDEVEHVESAVVTVCEEAKALVCCGLEEWWWSTGGIAVQGLLTVVLTSTSLQLIQVGGWDEYCLEDRSNQ